MPGPSIFLITGLTWLPLAAIAVVLFTNGNELILAIAAASVVLIATWFSHFDVFKISTVPDNRMLSRYLVVMGRSVLSIDILKRVRL
jgi:hypothetical protein